VAVAILLAAAVLHPPSLRSSATAFYGFITILLLGATGFVRAHQGANINAVIPAYAWLCILTGLSIHRILAWLEDPASGLAPHNAQLATCALWLALCAQLLAHTYQPGRWVPSRASLDYRYALLNAVRATPGDVWLVDHSYDGILAGKPLHPDWDAFDAILGLPYPPVVADFDRAIAQRRYAAILIDYYEVNYAPDGVFTNPAFRAAYGLRASAPGSDQPNVAGQPQLTLLPCDDLSQAPIPLLPAGSFVDASGCRAAAATAP
jgi:hypothetical protein